MLVKFDFMAQKISPVTRNSKSKISNRAEFQNSRLEHEKWEKYESPEKSPSPSILNSLVLEFCNISVTWYIFGFFLMVHLYNQKLISSLWMRILCTITTQRKSAPAIAEWVPFLRLLFSLDVSDVLSLCTGHISLLFSDLITVSKTAH